MSPLHLVAVGVEESEGRSIEWGGEGSVDSLPASGGESSQIAVIDSQMMDGRGSQMGHSSDLRTASPSFKELFARIHDAYAFGGYVGIAEQTGGNVRTVDSTTYDQPVERHVRHPSNGLQAKGVPARNPESTVTGNFCV